MCLLLVVEIEVASPKTVCFLKEGMIIKNSALVDVKKPTLGGMNFTLLSAVAF